MSASGIPIRAADVAAALKGIADAAADIHRETEELAAHAEGGTSSCRSVDDGTPTKEWLGMAPTGFFDAVRVGCPPPERCGGTAGA